MLVTGIVVNEKLNTPSDYRKDIRQAVYYCKKFGVGEHIKRVGGENETQYLRSLLGKITFVLQTRPKDKEFLNYKSAVLDMIAAGGKNGLD